MRREPTAALGFTLVEMMITVAIIGLMLGAAVLTIRNVTRSELRSAASRTAATLHFAFDRATMTGETLRVVLDLDKGTLWLEASKDRAALRVGREQHHAAKGGKKAGEDEAAADDAREKKKKSPMLPFGLLGGAGEGEEGQAEGGLMGFDSEEFKKEYERDLAPIARPKARFARIPGPQGKGLTLTKGIAIDAVVTPRLVEPATDGKAHVYFFPGGHAEPAIIHLADNADEHYSVVLHPLTGRARVYPCLYRIPEDFGVEDDKRKRSGGRDECAERHR